MKYPVAVFACLAGMLFPLQNTASAEWVRRVCPKPAPQSGERIAFEARVTGFKYKTFHVDFDTFGTDFSKVEIEFLSPPSWAGLKDGVYYQGDAVLKGVKLDIGSRFGFSAVPPACLDDPWLYLSEL